MGPEKKKKAPWQKMGQEKKKKAPWRKMGKEKKKSEKAPWQKLGATTVRTCQSRRPPPPPHRHLCLYRAHHPRRCRLPPSPPLLL